MSSLDRFACRDCHSLAPALKSRTPGLFKALKPVAELYAKASGHRGMGLKWDDLIIEENETVQKVSWSLRTCMTLRCEVADQSPIGYLPSFCPRAIRPGIPNANCHPAGYPPQASSQGSMGQGRGRMYSYQTLCASSHVLLI